MLSHIQNHYHLLRKSEAKVADWVLAHPNETVELSISALAQKAGVSEPTIMRFCHALNYDGFHTFKRLLDESLSSGVPFVHGSISPHDSTDSIITKLIDQSSAALLTMKQYLDAKELDEAIELLESANQVMCIGHGVSGVVANDIQQKLLRVGIPVSAYTDHHVHSLAASLLTPKDILIAVSHTGKSQDVIDSAQFALTNGAKVIAFAPKESALGEIASVVLESGAKEDTSEYMPMISRLADLAIVDILLVTLALKKGPEFRIAMENSLKIIDAKRIKE